MKKNRKIIGILGGMGPLASANLYKLLIEMSVRDFGAKNNDDFPEIILHSIPVPDFISNDKKRGEALEMLQERVKLLSNLNISSFSIACNTAHVLMEDLREVSKAQFVSMIEEVSKVVSKSKLRKVGLLATPSTINSGLYDDELSKFKIRTIIPSGEDLNSIEIIIRGIISGEVRGSDKLKLIKIASSLEQKGAQGIILGCTELPLIFPKNFPLPVFDSLEILARALLRNYYK